MPRSGRLASRSPALLALTSYWLDHTLEILGAVIVGDLFACLNLFPRPDPDAATTNDSFRIRLTRVIDITGDVAARAAVDRPPRIDAKEILPVTLFHFFV